MSKTGYIQNRIHHNSNPNPKASSFAPIFSLSSQAPAAYPVAPNSQLPTRDQSLLRKCMPTILRLGYASGGTTTLPPRNQPTGTVIQQPPVDNETQPVNSEAA